MLLLSPALAEVSHVFLLTRMLPPWLWQLLSFVPSIFNYSVVPIMTVPMGKASRGASPCVDAGRC